MVLLTRLLRHTVGGGGKSANGAPPRLVRSVSNSSLAKYLVDDNEHISAPGMATSRKNLKDSLPAGIPRAAQGNVTSYVSHNRSEPAQF